LAGQSALADCTMGHPAQEEFEPALFTGIDTAALEDLLDPIEQALGYDRLVLTLVALVQPDDPADVELSRQELFDVFLTIHLSVAGCQTARGHLLRQRFQGVPSGGE